MKIKIPIISLKNLKELFNFKPKPKKEISIPFNYEDNPIEYKKITNYPDAPSLEIIKNTYQKFLEEIKKRNANFEKDRPTEEELRILRAKASLEKDFGMFKGKVNDKIFDY